MKKLLIVLCLLIVFTPLLAETGSITGKVFEEESGEEKETLDRREKVTLKKSRLPADSVLLIPNSTDDEVCMYDCYNGKYLGTLIVDDTMGNYNLSTPINAIQGPDDNIYLSDQVSDAIFVFDSTGAYVRTYADTSDGLNNVRGIDFYNGHLFVTSGDDYVAEFDGPHSFVRYFIQDGSNPFDILFLKDGRSIYCDIQGSSDNVRLYDTSGVLIRELFSVSFPEQVQVDIAVNGGFLNNAFSAGLISEFTLDTVQNTFSFSSGRGIYRLGNGNLLATNGDGVFELDSATGTIIEQEDTCSARFIELYVRSPVGVDENDIETGEKIGMRVKPNPFINEVKIEILGLSEKSKNELGDIKIYNNSGRLIKTLEIPEYPYRLIWDGKDYRGEEVNPGVYFIRLKNNVKEKVVKIQ